MSIKFDFLCKDRVLATVVADYQAKTVSVQNFTADPIERPFGIRENPTIADLDSFFESRCFPESRYNKKAVLKAIGVDYYDPYLIVQKTHGRQLDDYMWIKFEGEELDYERDIKLRD